MVIGMHGRFAATCSGQCLIGNPGDNLIHIHVRLRAAAGLPDGQRELIVMLSGDDFCGRRFDGVGQRRVQPMFAVHPRRGLFYQCQRMHNPNWHPLMRGEGKVCDAPLRLRAPIGMCGDFNWPKTVGFRAGGFCHFT